MDDTTFPASRRPAGATRQGITLPAVPVGDDLPARCRTRARVAIALSALAVAGAVVAMVHATGGDAEARGDENVSVGVYLFAFAVFVALHLVMYAYRQARLAQVVRGASWQRSTHTVVTTGRGKSSQDRLELDATGLWYRPSNYLGAPRWVRSADEVEWAGQPEGYIAVRVPDGTRLVLFRLGK